MPSAVLQVERFRTHVAIVNTTVEEQAGVLVKHPLDIGVEAGYMVLGCIVVSGIQQVVTVIERELLDGIISKAVAQIEVQHQL